MQSAPPGDDVIWPRRAWPSLSLDTSTAKAASQKWRNSPPCDIFTLHPRHPSLQWADPSPAPYKGKKKSFFPFLPTNLVLGVAAGYFVLRVLVLLLTLSALRSKGSMLERVSFLFLLIRILSVCPELLTFITFITSLLFHPQFTYDKCTVHGSCVIYSGTGSFSFTQMVSQTCFYGKNNLLIWDYYYFYCHWSILLVRSICFCHDYSFF